MKIALIPNLEKSGAEEIACQVSDLLKSLNFEVVLPNDDENLYENCDIIITVGGDGTLIKHAKYAAIHNKPVIGINAGRLGYLADVDRDEIANLKKLTTGEYTIDSRIMLSVDIEKDGKSIFSGLALNDIVIGNGEIAKISDINLNILGDDINYRADGIILSTPTGSTAYSMSAGGPIIEPTTRCFIVTPICSHSMTARPLIVGQENIINLSVSESTKNAYLTVDGNQSIPIDSKTKIFVKKSNFEAKFINLSGRTFYKTLSYKF